jgi:signal transduction histidine kinase
MENPVDILLVDDEARNLDALEIILADPGYRLLRAQDADGALKLLLENDVAVIVLDIKMPGVSGFELARIIKDTKRFRETPIVFLTAYLVDDDDIVAGYGAGGVDYLTKPINPPILRQKVAVFADLFRKTRELAAVNLELGRLNEKLEERVAERTLELQKSEAQLLLAARQKDEFLAVLAHELRNPLAPLRTGIDLLRRLHIAATTPAPLERTLAVMDRQVHHLVRLIDDLLDVSRISRGLLELKRERVELAAIVRGAVDAARPWFERRQQVITLDAEGSFWVQADPTRVTQILTNLLHNAAKFTPQGGKVHVSVALSADGALIQVRDSGLGIRTDQLERVFDMFVRIERPGATVEPGLGIGLALARRLADLHGGSLTVKSDGEGQGTSFSLFLPGVAHRELAPPSTRPLQRPAAGAPLEIVVVEDNEDVAEVLVEWLRDLGHHVHVAHTCSLGIALICEKHPALVLCDLGLPDGHGTDVSRAVRATITSRPPLMVALTGWGREDDKRLTKEAGFDYHLVKPVNPTTLHDLIARIAPTHDEATTAEATAEAGVARA